MLGEKQTGWALNPAAEEFRSLEPNRALLRTLAEASGGRLLELDEVIEFVKSLPNLEALPEPDRRIDRGAIPAHGDCRNQQ